MRALAAIVGAAQTCMGRVAGLTSLELMEEALLGAVKTAGLSLSAIDGLITCPNQIETWMMPAATVARNLKIRPRFLSTVDLGGASCAAMVHQAAMAVASGAADCVLCIAAQPLYSGLLPEGALNQIAESATHRELERFAGGTIPSLYALLATRHMHCYGTTREQLASVAVQMRRHAALNTNAHFRNPIQIEDVLSSPSISTPLHRLDCAPVSDGGAAVLVVSEERARILKKRPAFLFGAGYGLSHVYLSDALDLMQTGAATSSKAAFRQAGLTVNDLDFACLYDCFSITLLMELEEIGFYTHGAAAAAVAAGDIDRNARRPINPGGGLLSGGHPGLPAGLLPIVEAAQQIMVEAEERQLPRTDLALVHGMGGILGMHCSLVIGGSNV
jgi:acetyl-CoA acetyltransferase